MGLSATLFAISQYAPQLLLTWQEGFVGALSIWTMVIQVPGSVVFVISIMLREGTTWSSTFPPSPPPPPSTKPPLSSPGRW